MPHSINEAEILIDNLLSYYNVSTYSDLALKIGTTQANISSWKIRNSINTIKNKCIKLNINKTIYDLVSELNVSIAASESSYLAFWTEAGIFFFLKQGNSESTLYAAIPLNLKPNLSYALSK